MPNRFVFLSLFAPLVLLAGGCFLFGDEGELVLVNQTDQPFYYHLIVADSVAGLNEPYSVDSATINLPKIEPGEKHTIDLRNKYAEKDVVKILVYAIPGENTDKAELVRTETIGIAFLEATYWAPVRIEKL